MTFRLKLNFPHAIDFYKDERRYFYQGRELTSVASLVEQVTPERSRLDERKPNDETDRGQDAKIQAYIKRVLHGEEIPANPVLRLHGRLPEMNGFDILWRRMQGMQAPRIEHVGWIIGDPELGVAGTVDTLLFSNVNGAWNIWEWKTGKCNWVNSYEKLLPPFDDLDNCEWNRYSLQLSMYRLIVERNTGESLGTCFLAHLDYTGAYQVYPAQDLRERILVWLSGNNGT